jgi:3-oxoacyl-[acyl-carrier protein] reductase
MSTELNEIKPHLIHPRNPGPEGLEYYRAKNAGQLALVTGVSDPEGIGWATAKKLAFLGYDIFGSYNSHSEAANEFVREMESFGVRSYVERLNMANKGEVKDFYEEAKHRSGSPVRVLVNNASIPTDKKYPDTTDDEALEYFQIDYLAAEQLNRYLCKDVMEDLKKGIDRYAEIAWSGSIRQDSLDGSPIYTITKAAMLATVRVMNHHYAPRIASSVARIGFTRTKMTRRLSDAQQLNNAMQTLLGDYQSPQVVAEAFAFAIERRTCGVLDVSGGYMGRDGSGYPQLSPEEKGGYPASKSLGA